MANRFLFYASKYADHKYDEQDEVFQRWLNDITLIRNRKPGYKRRQTHTHYQSWLHRIFQRPRASMRGSIQTFHTTMETESHSSSGVSVLNPTKAMKLRLRRNMSELRS